MIRIRGLDHVVLRARNPRVMKAFYVDVLGCTVERETTPESGLVQLRAGASLIDIVDVGGTIGRAGGGVPAPEGPNMDHFCVRLAEFNEAGIRTHLADHGVAAGDVESRYGAEGVGPSLYIRDPEGNTVELKGPPSESSESS